MGDDSITAYDLPQRVAAYDADMQVMHPLRSKMVAVALEVLPFKASAELTAVDLGVGTGFFTARFLEKFPSSKVVAIDGAASMIELARARLGPVADHVRFVVSDFRELSRIVSGAGSVDVMFSSYALHHLAPADKEDVIRQAVGLLRPGGWFFNADIVVAETAEIERRLQELRVEGILHRAAKGDERFASVATTRAFLDNLEATEADQPQTLAADLEIARLAGLAQVEVFWREYREVVLGSPK